MPSGPKFWIGDPPKTCDLCNQKIVAAFSDANLRGTWANVCDSCFRDYHGTYGIGRGQRYEATEDGKWKKTRG
jgi:ribosome-binding protein aMBF1 (putative translation factor)